MIWNLDAGWLMMAVATVAVLAFFFGSALDALMREDGFGSTGNMLIFTRRLLPGDHRRQPAGHTTCATSSSRSLVGLGGAFVCARPC